MAAETGPDRPARRLVLLVEDHAAGRRALARVLETRGYEVTAVATGAEGLDALGAGPPFAAVLTDLQLPDLDGREVAHAARQLVPAPFVALITGWTVESGAGDAARWGVDHVFLKPIRFDVLLARLDEALGGRE